MTDDRNAAAEMRAAAPDAGMSILQMINAMGPDPDFNDAVTAWIEADKARDRAARALERADLALQRREADLRAIFAHVVRARTTAATTREDG